MYITIDDETAEGTYLFPKLMIRNIPNSQIIVLFTDLTSGVVIHSNDSNYSVGKYLDNWRSLKGSSWKEFNGNIVMSNYEPGDKCETENEQECGLFDDEE